MSVGGEPRCGGFAVVGAGRDRAQRCLAVPVVAVVLACAVAAAARHDQVVGGDGVGVGVAAVAPVLLFWRLALQFVFITVFVWLAEG